MKFEEAMTAMRAGSKVRPVGEYDGWIAIKGDRFINDLGQESDPDGVFMITHEWVEVSE